MMDMFSNQKYHVKSLHEDTALRSRTWLEQQHIYHVMAHIILTDANSSEQDHGPSFFINAYIKEAYSDSALERLMTDDTQHSLGPRKERKIGYEEVARLFFLEIDWIMSHKKVGGKKLNKPAWEAFRRRGQRGDFSKFEEPRAPSSRKVVMSYS
jgi:hypothetical protein